jgi:predicted transcriptional regulator
MQEGDTRPTLDLDPDEAMEARLDAAAEADFRAGRVVPHDQVVEWLKSWGTANPLHRPRSKLP